MAEYFSGENSVVSSDGKTGNVASAKWARLIPAVVIGEVAWPPCRADSGQGRDPDAVTATPRAVTGSELLPKAPSRSRMSPVPVAIGE